MKILDQFINFVIRPPRAEYNPDQYLWEKDFTLAGKNYKREDLELTNGVGNILQCSHYVPSPFPEDVPLPCVIYCHGNSGCRADANEAAVILLPSNITVFTLDFSGSGLSGGAYVSLGWHEKEDLNVVISYLRNNKKISCIGLWGRSMGAVTSLLYGAEDPSIAGMVLDSAFSNLFDLMMELVDVYKIRLPKFTVKMGVQYMRRVIKKKAKFDIMDLNCIKVAPKTYIPALFGHASDDRFVQSRHSDLIFNSYAGDKNIIKFDGDHNSSRPQFYYDSVSIFFYNVLHPPQVSSAHPGKVDKYYDLANLKIGAGIDETVLYEIITGLRDAGSDPASSSSAGPSVFNLKLDEYLSGIAAVSKVADSTLSHEAAFEGHGPLEMQDKQSRQNEECCSYTSSNRESWGRCSSIGASDDGSSADCTIDISNHQVLATPNTSSHGKTMDLLDEEKKTKKTSKILKKLKQEKCERLEAFSHRLRIFFQKQVIQRRRAS